ncbi:MAG: potassium channel family protein, partial [Ilumatobacter sp.]|nr:potassium channel family protein [Ilumatobacter sp.]
GLFEGPVLDPDVASLPTYYSFEVLTTLGFGDITPVNDFVQRLTALEAMAGQIFLATLVARLVAMYGSSARSQ